MPKEKTAEEIVHKAMLLINIIKENNALQKKVKALQEENKQLLEGRK